VTVPERLRQRGRWCAVLGAAISLSLAAACRSVESRLETPVAVCFENTPFADTLRELSEQCGVPIELHESAAGSRAKPIWLRLDRVRCKDALEWILRLAGPSHLKGRYSSDRFTKAQWGALVYLVERERVVVVSGKEFLRRQPKIIRYYDLAGVCADPEEANQMMELITTTFAPGTWEDTDSPKPAWIRLRSGKLVVCHSKRVQRQIKGLLDSFRRSAHGASGTPKE